MKKLLYFLLGTILWSSPSLLLAASIPPDSASNETLILENTYWHYTTPYTPGERIVTYERIKNPHYREAYEFEIPQYQVKRTAGVLGEIRKDSILLDDEWVLIDRIQRINKPGKGSLGKTVGKRILLFFGLMLLGALLSVSVWLALYGGIPFIAILSSIFAVVAIFEALTAFTRKMGTRIGKRWKLTTKRS